MVLNINQFKKINLILKTNINSLSFSSHICHKVLYGEYYYDTNYDLYNINKNFSYLYIKYPEIYYREAHEFEKIAQNTISIKSYEKIFIETNSLNLITAFQILVKNKQLSCDDFDLYYQIRENEFVSCNITDNGQFNCDNEKYISIFQAHYELGKKLFGFI